MRKITDEMLNQLYTDLGCKTDYQREVARSACYCILKSNSELYGCTPDDLEMIHAEELSGDGDVLLQRRVLDVSLYWFNDITEILCKALGRESDDIPQKIYALLKPYEVRKDD